MRASVVLALLEVLILVLILWRRSRSLCREFVRLIMTNASMKETNKDIKERASICEKAAHCNISMTMITLPCS